MKTEEKMLWGVCGAALLASAAAGLHGQAVGATDPAPRVVASLPEQDPAPGEFVREIDDPNTGARWLLLRDTSHPGGPGRLVLASGLRNGDKSREQGAELGATPALAAEIPAVRKGDKLVVEENTATVEARLEAVALGPGAIGSTVQARLTIGGKVVRALVLAPGRAALQAEAGVRP